MKTDDIKVSVVLPIRNDAEFCSDAIQSILDQSHKRIELIIIDDGSTDSTPEIVREFVSQDARIVHLTNDKPLGLPVALNRGVRVATGDFIARMDSDDLSSFDRIERQLSFIFENQIDVAGCAIQIESEIGKKTRLYPETPAECNFSLLFESCFCHPAVMGRREHFVDFPYNETLTTSQDYDLWCRMSQAGLQLGNIQETLFTYRERTNSHSSRSKKEKERIARCVQRRYCMQVLTSERLPVILGRFRFATDRPTLDDAKALLSDLAAEELVDTNAIKVIERKLSYVRPMRLGLYLNFLKFQKMRFGRFEKIGLTLLTLCLFKIDPRSIFVRRLTALFK